MRRPRLLDLFCGAGGSAMGYHRVGFDIVGVDNKPQPNYPFPFVQADALDWLGEWVLGGHELFEAVHASPPCQVHVRGMRAVNRGIGRDDDHVDLVPDTRQLLRETGLPYVIENVVSARLEHPVVLCGTSLGLPLRRHRLFESNVPLMVPPCAHGLHTEKKYWQGDRSRRLPDGTREYVGDDRGGSTVVQVYGHAGGKEHWPAAMGIDWMTSAEMAQAIPPAYTELVGGFLLQHAKIQSV